MWTCCLTRRTTIHREKAYYPGKGVLSLRDKLVMQLAAEICRRQHPDMDCDLRFYRRGGPPGRDWIGEDARETYITLARVVLGR